MERIIKEHPYTIGFLGLVGLAIVASSIQEVGTAMSGIFVQLGWCGQENYICKISYWALIIFLFVIFCIILDFFHKQRKSSKIQQVNSEETETKQPKTNISIKAQKRKNLVQISLYHVSVETAYLEVQNRDKENGIKECIATLEKVEYFREPFFSPIPIYKDERLRWDEKYYPSADCQLNISPKGRAEINIFKDIEEKKYPDGSSDYGFQLCKHSDKTDFFGLYVLRIRIDGKKNINGMDVPIQPIYFNGYLYLETINAINEYTENYDDIVNGKVVKKTRHVKEPYTYNKIIFEKGDWKKDSRILLPR